MSGSRLLNLGVLALVVAVVVGVVMRAGLVLGLVRVARGGLAMRLASRVQLGWRGVGVQGQESSVVASCGALVRCARVGLRSGCAAAVGAWSNEPK